MAIVQPSKNHSASTIMQTLGHPSLLLLLTY